MSKLHTDNLNPYEALANAIVKSAAEDYMRAYRKYMKKPERKGYYEDVMREEKFFKSEWFRVLTNVDPVYLVNHMQEVVERDLLEKGYGRIGGLAYDF